MDSSLKCNHFLIISLAFAALLAVYVKEGIIERIRIQWLAGWKLHDVGQVYDGRLLQYGFKTLILFSVIFYVHWFGLL